MTTTKLIQMALCLIMSLAAGTAVFAADTLDTPSTTASGDAVNGERLFLRCKACHTLTLAARPRLGPSLEGLFGRTVGSLDGYRYSRALSDADFVWTAEALDAWLKDPNGFLPGNQMAFAGFRKSSDREDLIAYLKAATLLPATD